MEEKKIKLLVADCDLTEKEFSAEERSFTQYISTKAVDRGKDVVSPSGMIDKNFAKNPIVLFNHDTDKPIGRSLWRKSDDKGVLAKTVFSKTDFADDVYTLFMEKILNAWSIGFMPKEWSYDKEKQITTFDKWELFEYSAVSLPMNPEALNEAKGMVKGAEALYIIKQAESQFAIRESLSSMDSVESLTNKMNELETLVKSSHINEGLISDIEKLENEVAKLKSQLTSILLSNKFSAETLDIDVKQIVDNLFKV